MVPNTIAPNSQINFSCPPSCELIGPGAIWKYKDDGSDQGTVWSASGFIDSGWFQGPAALGVESNPIIAPLIQTPLSVTSGKITYYFRHQFNFPGNPAGVALLFSARIDDGAVFYLNGSEVQRIRMPTGTIISSTLASSSPPTTDAVNLDLFTVTSPALVTGNNVLAVEVHQVNSGSTDVVFDLTVQGCPPPGNCSCPGTPAAPPNDTPATVSGCLKYAGPTPLGVVGTFPPLMPLLSQQAVNGPWREVSGATSPHPVGSPTGQMFFRLRLQ